MTELFSSDDKTPQENKKVLIVDRSGYVHIGWFDGTDWMYYDTSNGISKMLTPLQWTHLVE